MRSRRRLSSRPRSAGAPARRASSAARRSRSRTRSRWRCRPSRRPTTAISTPPSDGPTTDAVWNMMVLRLIAFGRCSRGTRLGTSALRAGRSKAPTADADRREHIDRPDDGDAAERRSRRDRQRPSSPPSASASISRRRSHASATTPLIIEKMTTGMTRTRPTKPSARPLRSGGTSSDTCHSSAAFCIIDPVNETSRPIQISR